MSEEEKKRINELSKKKGHKLDEEFLKELEKSRELAEEIYPCLRELGSGLLDGFHRKAINPDWPEKNITIIDNLHRLQVKVAANLTRRSASLEEKQELITEAREILQSKGKKGTQEEIAVVLGKSQSWVAINDPVEHQIHPPTKVLMGNTFSPPQKPEFILPKIELREEFKPTPSEGKIPDELMALICPHCGIDINVSLSVFPLDRRRKEWLKHIDVCLKNPHRIEQPTKKKDIPSPQYRLPISSTKTPIDETKEHETRKQLSEHDYFKAKIDFWDTQCQFNECYHCSIREQCLPRIRTNLQIMDKTLEDIPEQYQKLIKFLKEKGELRQLY